MTHLLKRALVPLAAAACALFTSCGDDPLGPTGTYVAPEYHATLQSLNTHFSSVCGAGDNELYAFGGALLHYDGSTWNPISPPPGDVRYRSTALGFATGEIVLNREREVHVYSGGTWTQLDDVPDYGWDFWGSAPDDLYALTYDGIYRYQGTTWELMPVENVGEISRISGDEAGRPILCGAHGRIDRFDGTDWTTTYLDSTLYFQGAAVTASGKIFAVESSMIYEMNGNSVTPILDRQIYDPQLRADGETLYAAGQGPRGYRIAAYQDGAWSAISEGDRYARDFWAKDGQLVCVGDDNLIWQGTPDGGAPVTIAPSHGEIYDAVAIGDAIYTIGRSANRFHEGTWTNLDKEYITRNEGFGIDGRRPDDIYVVGREMILHYDGAAWEWVNGGLGTSLNAVWVEQDGNVVAVGSGPVIVEYDGVTWTKRYIPFDTYALFDVTGVGNMIFAVGDGGMVAMRKQNHWYLVRPTGWDLHAVWGWDEQHVYAAGANDNVIYFYDGNRWEPQAIEGPTLSNVTSIWGTSFNNIFVLDRDGTLAHFNGTSWSGLERVLAAHMATVTGIGRDVLTVGAYGAVLYRK